MVEFSKVSREKLRIIQKRIAKRIILLDKFSKPVRMTAGFDLAFRNDRALVTGVVLDHKHLQLKEVKSLEVELSFPYIPTFLTFREGPAVMKVYKKLKIKPDIMMINGHGIAHPLFCGIASHVGVLLNNPSIGIAQNSLIGDHKEPIKLGSSSIIKYKNRKIGYAYKSKENCRPIIISPGHRISLDSSLEIVKKCIKNNKLPEPICSAHMISNKIINTESV